MSRFIAGPKWSEPKSVTESVNPAYGAGLLQVLFQAKAGPVKSLAPVADPVLGLFIHLGEG